MNHALSTQGNDFAIQTIGDGIYAAIAVNGGHAICNSGLIDLGGQILLYDTFISPTAATRLRNYCVEYLGQAPDIIINSHFHNDHIWGNQTFADDGLIVSSSRTREEIMTSGKEELQWFTANSAQKLADLQDKYQSSKDEKERQELLLWIGEYSAVVESLPQLKIISPTVTFPNSLEIHGIRRRAQLLTYENGHTVSDTILFLPEEGILFLSDLLFVGMHPYLGDGDPIKLIEALRQIRELKGEMYVPGHGIIGTRKDIDYLIAYIEICCETADELVKTGNPLEDGLSTLRVPAEYRHWMVSQFYPMNIRCIYEKVLAARGSN